MTPKYAMAKHATKAPIISGTSLAVSNRFVSCAVAFSAEGMTAAVNRTSDLEEIRVDNKFLQARSISRKRQRRGWAVRK